MHFDALKTTAFSRVAQTMGYAATWTPEGGSELTAKVLLTDPTGRERLQGAQFTAIDPFIEFMREDLPGLYEATRDLNPVPEITINGRTYYGRSAELDVDDDLVKIYLEPA